MGKRMETNKIDTNNQITCNDIVIDVGDKNEFLKCKYCTFKAKNKTSLCGHLGAKHRVELRNYIINFYIKESIPVCDVCGKETRFRNNKLAFKKYCPDHADEGRRTAGKTHVLKKEIVITKPQQEKEVLKFIKSFYSGIIHENTREIIPPKELDIFIPEKKFAIEYNGLYWHTYIPEDPIRSNNKKKHKEKTDVCNEKGIKLFHIFSDEWNNKQDIVKSMIKHRMGLTDRKIHARKCEVVELDKKEGSEFFKRSHISGDNRAQKYIGLKYNNELVSCVSLKVPIQKKHGNIMEIARFANALNTSVNGGFQKLFKRMKEYVKSAGYDGILTYVDLRFGFGETYSKSGFKLIGKSGLDYWYCKTDGSEEKRIFRFAYRAQKPLTERQVAENAGVSPIYGCGSNIFLYSLT